MKVSMIMVDLSDEMEFDLNTLGDDDTIPVLHMRSDDNYPDGEHGSLTVQFADFDQLRELRDQIDTFLQDPQGY